MSQPRKPKQPEPSDEGAWLSVARYAFLADVSERTARRRCESGRVRARRETTSRGVAWLIHPGEVRPGAAKSSDGAATNAARDFEAGKGDAPDVAAPMADGAATDLLSHVLEENRFLRAALEQHQRSEAELRAALREALKAQPRQLPAASTEGARIEQNEQQIGAANTVPTSPKNAPESSGIAPDDEMSADELLALCRRICRV